MFSLANIPEPVLTPLGRPITGGFKYRVLGFDADTPLEDVAQTYAHRKSEVSQFREILGRKYTYVVTQEWDKETNSYK
jgi:murein endopeptidase